VLAKILAVFEVEFVLAAFFGGAGGRIAVLGRRPSDGVAELLVHKKKIKLYKKMEKK
jgi:hypothetical protein